MAHDIFEFWSRMPEGLFEHPDDTPVLDRGGHEFARNCCASPFIGKLRTAPVVLLFASPGLADSDPEHSASPIGKVFYRRQLTGQADLPTGSEHPSAERWIASRLRQFDLCYRECLSKVATFDIGAYKSRDLAKSRKTLFKLPSSIMALKWAQTVLFPEARAGKRVVICMRARVDWSIYEPRDGMLFAPKTTRRGDVKLEDRKAISDAIQVALKFV